MTILKKEVVQIEQQQHHPEALMSAAATSQIVNPFIHKLELVSSTDKILTALLTVFLLPIRVIIICVLLVTSWLLACIGLFGISEEELATKPMTGWRLTLKSTIAMVGRMSYLAGGIGITVKGVQASRKEAAILVIAPHSTFLDSVVVYVTNMCSVMVRKESMDNYAGKLINFTQPIYVWRDDPNSRQNTIKEIIERANSKEDWPQIIIFPEGTCTNRSALITFKPGAFYPGLPVQPVCIRYPNELDTVTWTWEGPGLLKLLWLTLTRIHSHCEIEFLPVYVPSNEEKRDPKLYARNVRSVMAKALGVPVSDYTFDDCKILTRARQMNLPHAADIVDVEKLRQNICLDRTNIEERIVNGNLITPINCLVNLAEFSLRLQISSQEVTTKRLFSIFDKKRSGQIDIREYLICALFLIKREDPIIDLLHLVSMMYETGDLIPGILTRDALHSVVKCVLAMSRDESDAVFAQIDSSHHSFIKFSDFREFLLTHPEYSYIFLTSERINKLKSKHD